MEPALPPATVQAAPATQGGGGVDRGRRALGRGLSALLPAVPAPSSAAERRGPQMIPIEEIHPERGQPRKFIDKARIDELAASIKAHGVLQPILVRRGQRGYQIVCGERRWRAAQIAGLREVPALVREASDDQAFELALVENIQRQDLSPIEEAEAYRRLIDEHGLTQEELAARVGKDRATIANTMRLLRLPEDVKSLITQGALSMGHARALLGIADDAALRKAAQEVARTRMSVRAAERLAQRLKAAGGARGKGEEPVGPSVQALIESLQRALGARVRLESRGGKGTLTVEFASLEQLDGIVTRILGTS